MILLLYLIVFDICYYLMLHSKLREIWSTKSSNKTFLVLLYSIFDSFMTNSFERLMLFHAPVEICSFFFFSVHLIASCLLIYVKVY